MRYRFHPAQPGHIIRGLAGRTLRAGDEVVLNTPPHPSLVRFGLRSVEAASSPTPAPEKASPEQEPASPAAPVESPSDARPVLDGLHHSKVRAAAKRLGWTGKGTAAARDFLDTVDGETLAAALAD